MNIESRRTNYNWNEVIVTDEGTTISVDINAEEAQALKDQLEEVIYDLNSLMNEYETDD